MSSLTLSMSVKPPEITPTFKLSSTENGQGWEHTVAEELPLPFPRQGSSGHPSPGLLCHFGLTIQSPEGTLSRRPPPHASSPYCALYSC